MMTNTLEALKNQRQLTSPTTWFLKIILEESRSLSSPEVVVAKHRIV